MKAAVNVIHEAAATVKKGWCQGYSAFDKNHCPTICADREAVQVCLDTALWRASRRFGYKVKNAVYESVRQAVGGDIVCFNDHYKTTKKDVLAALRKAAKLAESS